MRTQQILLSVCLVVTGLLVTVYSCKKTNPKTEHNPYDDIKRDSTSGIDIPLDSLTITYVHKKVLSSRCALNGCHDGHFEPDYRTPQSSYSTLVYAPIVKNNLAGQYKYRVIPFDTTNSVLYIRVTNCCFVNHNDRMPQDNIGVPLPDSSLNVIRQWIMHGARDMFGNITRLPNEPPVISPGYGASSTDYQTIYSNNRLDSVYYNPFVVPTSVANFYLIVNVTDDSTAISQLQVNQLKISTHADDFSAATTVNAFYFNAGSNGQYWVANIATSGLPTNDTLYMRYYVNDGAHAVNTEFPRTELPYPYKTYWSFIRQ